MKRDPALHPLPYADTKAMGAADFYFAINATFRFIAAKLGPDGLRRYWTDLGRDYFRPVTERWKRGGLRAVADYWRAFFQAEPGGEVEVQLAPEMVVVAVRVCPAIGHLRAHGREIAPGFCRHCQDVSEAMAAPANLTVRVEGGNGACRQVFMPHDKTPPTQELSRIREVV